jgi:UDP-N-acetylmuramoyl-L-alanyl-D-glutamate--2,6-diaminopimelate ligase
MELGALIAGLDVRFAEAGEAVTASGVRVCDLTDDSRTVVPGSLFIARGGTKTDGKKFVADALAAGAVAVLTDDQGLRVRGDRRAPVLHSADLPRAASAMAERFYGNPSRKLTLIGVTGTNGKTTTAHLVHQIMNGAGVRCGLIGTVVIDDGREVGEASMTTPPATELSRTFGTMVEAGCGAAVMETSSHALDQGRVAALSYRVGVFTNLTGDHLDYHGTMEAYGAAKARLFGMLPADGWAVVNAEDPGAAQMAQGCRARVLGCRVAVGAGAPAMQLGARAEECCATVLAMSMAGTRVVFEGPWGRFEATIRLVGRHNTMNALQAVAACFAAGVPAGVLERQIATAVPPPGRLEPVTTARDSFAVFVDYAHTDDALRKVLATVGPLVNRDAGGRLAVVFGCGGDRDRTKRPRMGAAAAEMADLVYVTSDNPRSERPSDIIDEILRGIPEEARGKVSVDADRRQAIVRAMGNARGGDVVVIAGKGHETYQISSDGKGGLVTRHFDDREVARAALVERKLGKSGLSRTDDQVPRKKEPARSADVRA